MFLAFPAFYHAVGAKAVDKRIAHIGQSCLAVRIEFAFHFRDGVLHHILLVVREVQGVQHGLVALHQFGGSKPRRRLDAFRVVLHKVRNGVDRPMYRAGTKILAPWILAVLRGPHSGLDQFVNALVFAGRDRDHRHPEFLLQFVNLNGPAVRADLVHHIEGDYHRDIQLNQLHTQIKVALDIGCIHDVDNPVRFIF